jgi:hypothetical protein
LAHGGCLARISCCMQCSIAWHWMPCFRTNGCAHGSSTASLECLVSNHWLHTWRQHVAWHMVPSSNQLLHARQHRLARDASLRINGCTRDGSITWHMVPRSNQILHAMQHRVARDASLQNQWLRTWQQDCVAYDASLRINGCAHGGRIAWHMVPSLNQLLHANQCSIAWHGMPRFRVDSCEHGSGVAWLAMLRFESMAAHMAAASLGTWCLARISCCMQCSIAWHWMPRSRINGCTHGSGVA